MAIPEGVEGDGATWAEATFQAAWDAIAAVERAMSRFDPDSDVARFNAARPGAVVEVCRDTAHVLRVARYLARCSRGLFDVSLGSGPGAWSLSRAGRAFRLGKRAAGVRLDLGGIAKGHAVDGAFDALGRGLRGEGAWWVNAGGDLRVHGVELPVRLRDEEHGGARPWIHLREGALATSWFGPGARSELSGRTTRGACHVSVLSPRCLWSDAFTKIVGLTSRTDLPLLARHGATAVLHLPCDR